MATDLRISGSGSQYSNTHGTQNNNSGSGNQFNANTISYNAQNQSDSQLLADLRVTDPRDDKRRIERRKGGLLRDSYRWILEHEAFIRWQANTQSSLLWIRGDPGKGKTMLVCGIIDELPACMPGWETIYFFCEATDSRLNNATAVLRSLLYLLLRKRPSLSRFICEEHEHAGKRLFEDANSWDVLDGVFTKILQDGGLDDIILVIDALDECIADLDQLLEIVVRLSSSNIKVIASSRNWLNVEEAMTAVSKKVCVSLELNRKSISTAVNHYISHKVDQLAVLKGYDITTRDEVCDYITTHANDTFLWVALVIEQLRTSAKRYTRTKLKEFPRKLDALYNRMLARTWDSEDRQLCRQILAVVSIVCRPVTLLELMSLAGLEIFCNNTESLEEIIGECGSLLAVKDSLVYFVHQSAKDFLLQRALGKIMPSGIRHEHNLLFSRSLDIMARTCRRNIYDLKEPGASLDDIRTPVPDPLGPARYACVYWLEHFNDGGRMDEQQYSQVYYFLKQHFLHWIEALSLLKSMSRGIVSLFKLARAIQELEISEQKLFVQDALRFIRYFRVVVEGWPLQVYSSALAFSPTHSIIRREFQSEVADWIIRKPVVDDEWSSCLQTLEGHRGRICSLAISPDGATLASASVDKTVIVWDMVSGQSLRTLQGHERSVVSVAFSLKGDKLASACTYGIVKIWDHATGQLLHTFHNNFSGLGPFSVAFCAGDKQVALGSFRTLQIWDTATGHCGRKFEGLQTSWRAAGAFSADGAFFAACSVTGRVALLDTETGECSKTPMAQRPLSGLSSSSIVFLRDGVRLVTFNRFNGLISWDMKTCQPIWIDKGTSLGTGTYMDETSIASSRDGGLIACGAADHMSIEIRDGETGKFLQKLHGGFVSALAFSADGTQLISGSPDQMIRIWDISRIQRCQVNEPRLLISNTTSTAMSPKTEPSEEEASALSGDVKRSKTAHGFLSSHLSIFHADAFAEARATAGPYLQASDASYIIAVAFSSDGKQLVSLSRDGCRLWDSTTGQCLKTTSLDWVSWVASIAYSRYGIQIAHSNVHGDDIEIMDAATGRTTKILRDSGEPTSIAFSRDGLTLASSSNGNRSIKLWDWAMGHCKMTLDVAQVVLYMRFSESGSQLFTDVGTINLESMPTTSASISMPQTANITRLDSQGLMLSLELRAAWIQKDSKSILWIPPEYRAPVFDVKDGTIALGLRSGRPLIMGFKSDFSNF